MENGVTMQPGLFEVVTPSTYRFITNRMNLLTILDAGFVDVAARSWRYSPDSRNLYDGRVPLICGLAPEELQPLWEEEGQDFPLALEFTEQLKEWVPEAALSNQKSQGHLIVVEGLIPLKYLKRIVFRNAQEREDYVLRSFDEPPFGDAFFSTAEPGYMDWNKGDTPSRFVTISTPEQVSERAGAVIAMLDFYEFSNNSVDLLTSLVESMMSDGDANLLSLCREGMLLTGSEDEASSGAVADKWLLKTVFDYCAQLAGPEEFTQDRLIELISKELGGLESELQRNIGDWLQYISKIFDSEIDVPQLPDGGSVVKRAVLLFALRPAPARFEKLVGSSLQAGPKVRLLAACFLGALCGHQNLGSPLREDPKLYFNFIASILERLMGQSQAVLLETRVPEPEGLMSRYELLYQGGVIKEWTSEPDPVLARVYYQALGVGFVLHYDHMCRCLWTRIDLPGGRKQKVYVARSRPNSRGDVVLRFYSPCLDLRSKGTRLLKEHLYDLLRRNSEPGMHCRFAIDEALQAVTVVIDQIQSTMDEKELIAHLEHVASTADAYEKETVGTDNY